MITIIYPYYMNNVLMNKHIETWKTYSSKAKANIKFIVVDDGSPFPLTSRQLVNWEALPVGEAKMEISKGLVNLEQVEVNLEVYRIREDLGYNLSGAKNLGALLAQTDWIFPCDFDYVLPSECADRMIEYCYEPGHIYFPAWRKLNGKMASKHENNYIVEKWEFWNHGGYDEDFAGFYAYEETYFVSHILCSALKRVQISDFWVDWYHDGVLPHTEWPRCKKDFRRNHDLCYAKIDHKISHSRRSLRFSWIPVFRYTI